MNKMNIKRRKKRNLLKSKGKILKSKYSISPLTKNFKSVMDYGMSQSKKITNREMSSGNY